MKTPEGSKTAQGYEQQLGVNALGPYLLTHLLLPTMESTAIASSSEAQRKGYNIVRIINVSSNLHQHLAPKGGFNFKDPNIGHRKPWTSYGQSKYLNVVHSLGLARRYGAVGITSHALNPGIIGTELIRHSTWYEQAFLVSIILLLREQAV